MIFFVLKCKTQDTSVAGLEPAIRSQRAPIQRADTQTYRPVIIISIICMSGIIRIINVDVLCGARHFAATVAILEFGRSRIILDSSTAKAASDPDSASTANAFIFVAIATELRVEFVQLSLDGKGLVLVLSRSAPSSACPQSSVHSARPEKHTESGFRALSGNLSAVDLRTRFECMARAIAMKAHRNMQHRLGRARAHSDFVHGGDTRRCHC